MIGPVEQIIRICCEHFRYTREDLMSESRLAPIVHARHAAWFLIDEMTNHSRLWIANRFGRDHTTIRSAVHKIERLQATDPQLRRDLAALRAKIAALAGASAPMEETQSSRGVVGQ